MLEAEWCKAMYTMTKYVLEIKMLALMACPSVLPPSPTEVFVITGQA